MDRMTQQPKPAAPSREAPIASGWNITWRAQAERILRRRLMAGATAKHGIQPEQNHGSDRGQQNDFK